MEYISFDIYLMVELRLVGCFPQADAFLGVCWVYWKDSILPALSDPKMKDATRFEHKVLFF